MFLIMPNYIIIPVITLMVSIVGKYFAGTKMTWYRSLSVPRFTPPDWVFAVVWQIIFFTTTASALLFWNYAQRNFQFWVIIALFLGSALLTVEWPYLFFRRHFIGWATFTSAILLLLVYSLFLLLLPISSREAFLLLPAVCWLTFALLLNISIWFLNK
jgi:benzodiazapine receptor